MSKVIIKNELGDTLEQELNAANYAVKVMQQGKISGKLNNQYCYVTTFFETSISEIRVYTTTTKNGTHVFTVSRRYL